MRGSPISQEAKFCHDARNSVVSSVGTRTGVAVGVEPMSRRVFIKSALTGAAGSVLPESSTARPAATAPTALSLAEAAQLVRHKKISPVGPTQAGPDPIEGPNPRPNAFFPV